MGAGFATGQELLQFFANYGIWSYFAALVAGLIITFITRQTAKLGYVLQTESYEVALENIFGKFMAKIFDYILIFFLYGLSVIMIAGTGSGLYDGFGVPTWLGTLITVIVLFFVMQLDFTNIVKVLGIITPFLIIAVLIIAGYNVISPTIPLSEVDQYTDISRTPSGVWIWDAITYAGLVVANSFSFMVIIGGQSRNHFISQRTALIGGLIFTGLVVLMTAGLVANLEVANAAELPTLLLADQIHPGVRILMAVVMVGVIFNSVIGVLFPFLKRFTAEYSPKYKILLLISLVVAYLVSFIGFVDLVNFFYPIFGYIGMFITIALFIRWIYNKTTNKKLL
ncbi:YkvI family membrane protein [Corticicoccus populi]|uniref:Branched-chain amino acid transport system II carrier protein n=1 Tax=Corticicoccus populi TaxID=1812821 RepID=A0ABW5X122_9STAP